MEFQPHNPVLRSYSTVRMFVLLAPLLSHPWCLDVNSSEYGVRGGCGLECAVHLRDAPPLHSP